MDRAPYFEALKQYLEERPHTFHIPAHRQGLATPVEFEEILRQYGTACDITEVLGIDDIHDAHAQVAEAEGLAAEFYGVPKTKFLVNGSSCGVQVMLWTVLQPGDLVVAPNNCHRSFFSGLLQCGARAEFPVDLRASLKKAKALFLTSPTYHGEVREDLHELLAEAKENGVITLVDEAWGAHLISHPDLPPSATGHADMVVQSVHKMAAGLTQSAWLHYDPNTIDEQRLHKLLRHLQTSSPSALLVASMDCARRQLAIEGHQLWGKAIQLAKKARQALKAPNNDDPTRLQLKLPGYTGYEIEEKLRRDHGIQVEMSELHQALCLVTPGHTEEHIDHLIQAVQSFPKREPKNLESLPLLPAPEVELTVREAFHARTTTSIWEKAVDRISAELLYCYPPGVPLLFPGQRITPELIQYLKVHKELGGTIQGGIDPERESILVVEDI